MKKIKGCKKILLIALIISIVAAVGVAVAYMIIGSENVNNDFVPATVACEVNEQFDGTVKSSITVSNTGKIDSFIRVRFVSYWVNASGEIVGKPSETPAPAYNSAEWDYDEAQYTYYCKKAIAAGKSTPELLSGNMVLREDVFNGETVYQVVEVIAEAIQANPADAASQAWNRTFA